MATTLDLAHGSAHYKDSRIAGRECIELTHLMSFSAGNVTKYLWRAGKKAGDPAEQDLTKALHYISFLEAEYIPCWIGVYPPNWYPTWKALAIREGAADLVSVIDDLSLGLYASARLKVEGFLTLTKEYA